MEKDKKDFKNFFDYRYYNYYEEKPKELEWMVIVENINGREIVPFNIFHHSSFMASLYKNKKTNKDNKEKFIEQLKRDLSYYYGSKSEWEVIVTSWPPYVESEEIDRLVQERADRIEKWGKFYRTDVCLDIATKIDVYSQVRMNWNQFVDYVWSNLKKIKNPNKRK